MGTKTLLHPSTLVNNTKNAIFGITRRNWTEQQWIDERTSKAEKALVKQLRRRALFAPGMNDPQNVNKFLSDQLNNQNSVLMKRFNGNQEAAHEFITDKLMTSGKNGGYDFGGQFKTGWRGSLSRATGRIGSMLSPIGTVFRGALNFIPVLGQVIALVNTLSWVGQGFKIDWDWFK